MKCSVENCHNNSKNRRGISFFRFPKETTLKRKWLEAIGRPHFNPNAINLICDEHFLYTDVEHFTSKSILKPGAVPFIKMDNVDDAHACMDDDKSSAVDVVTNDNVIHKLSFGNQSDAKYFKTISVLCPDILTSVNSEDAITI